MRLAQHTNHTTVTVSTFRPFKSKARRAGLGQISASIVCYTVPQLSDGLAYDSQCNQDEGMRSSTLANQQHFERQDRCCGEKHFGSRCKASEHQPVSMRQPGKKAMTLLLLVLLYLGFTQVLQPSGYLPGWNVLSLGISAKRSSSKGQRGRDRQPIRGTLKSMPLSLTTTWFSACGTSKTHITAQKRSAGS